jgi:hypothetical protein
MTNYPRSPGRPGNPGKPSLPRSPVAPLIPGGPGIESPGGPENITARHFVSFIIFTNQESQECQFHRHVHVY